MVHEATKRFDIKLRPINTKKFAEEVRMWLEIYNSSLVGKILLEQEESLW